MMNIPKQPLLVDMSANESPFGVFGFKLGSDVYSNHSNSILLSDYTNNNFPHHRNGAIETKELIKQSSQPIIISMHSGAFSEDNFGN